MSTARNAHFAIDPIFIDRWSPRAFTGEAIDEGTLFTLFEAARWAPSANNSQPWRFIYALKDSASWPGFFGLLHENNQRWAVNASVLVVLVSKTTHVRNGDTEPSPLGVPQDYSVEVAIAIGRQAEHTSLPPDLQEREQPNQRKPIGKFISEGRFTFAE